MPVDKDNAEEAERTGQLTLADLVVLSLIRERPMHGYEIMKEYERQQVSDWAKVSRAHVYYALAKLAKRGLVVGSGDDDDPRGKAVHAITKLGSRALSEALGAKSWSEDRTPTLFDSWLGLSLHARPADRRRVLIARRDFLEEQIEKERNSLSEIEAHGGADAEIAAAMVGLAIEQFETELRWLTRFENALSV